MKNCWMAIVMGLMLFSCVSKSEEKADNNMMFTGKEGEVKLIILVPGHFHTSLLQKSSMTQVNDSIYVYALPDDTELNQYLTAIESFNNRTENPTAWQEIMYTGDDFLDKMVSDRKGNVVILAGNNKDKTEYILSAINAGLNVLLDKPMVINREDFHLLEEVYSNAKTNNVKLYNMMTGRYDILNIIEKELVNDNDFFGELQEGTPENPAVYMESVHHFYKEVSDAPLVRPGWYYNVEQQGEGIADVTTHLIDLVFWKFFPGQAIDYRKNINNISATHSPTKITLTEFSKSTRQPEFPAYLQKYLDNSLLNVYTNGTVNFDLKNHNIGLKVIWNYQAPNGSGDTFVSVINGTKAILKMAQGKEQQFVKQLYTQKPDNVNEKKITENLQKAIERLKVNYPFVSISPPSANGEYLINIPTANRDGHESHFKYVAEIFFNFLVNQNMPEWKISNTRAKYYITTEAVEVTRNNILQ
ncbi:MAG: putative oxidoreductase C-terminal domain-containing protein [Petrimonas sp.]|jgi:predicted dehydrogenase